MKIARFFEKLMPKLTPGTVFLAGFQALLFLLVICGSSNAQSNPHDQKAAFIHEQGEAFMKKQQWDSAIVHYQQAISQYQQARNSNGILFEHIYLAFCLNMSNQLERFIEYEKDLQPYLLTNDTLVAQVELSLGSAHFRRGNFLKAIDYYDRAEKDTKRHGDTIITVLPQVYNNQAIVFRRTGDLDKALIYYEKVLALYQSAMVPISKQDVGNTYINIGTVYYRQQVYDQALDAYRSALTDLKKQKGAKRYIYQAQMGMARAYQELQRYDSSMYYLEKSLNLINEKSRYWSTTLNEIGNVFSLENKHKEAIETHKKAVRHRENQYKGKRHINLGVAYRGLADAYKRADSLELADEFYYKTILQWVPDFSDTVHQALPGIEQLPKDMDLLEILQSKVDGLVKFIDHSYEDDSNTDGLNRIPAALDHFRLLFRLADSIRLDYQTDQAKLFQLKEIIPSYEKAIKLTLTEAGLVSTRDSRRSQALIREAFEFARKSKAAILREKLQQNYALTGGNLPDSLRIRQQEIQVQIVECEKQLTEAKEEGLKNTLQQRRFGLYQELEKLIQLWESNYPDYYRLKYTADQHTLEELQASLESGEIMIEYFWGEEYVYFFKISKEGIAYPQDMPETAYLRQLLLDFIPHLKDGSLVEQSGQSKEELTYFASTSLELYKRLISKNIDPTTQKLIIVPDGLLNYLPFGVLVSNWANKNSTFANLDYLIKKIPVRYRYSSFLENSADISYSKASEIFAGFAPAYGDINTRLQNQTRSLNAGITGLDRGDFQPLLNTQPEVQAISGIFGGDAILGNEATESYFREIADGYRLLLIAAHGFTNDQEPLFSGIAFSEEVGNDGILYAYEIANMNLHAELMVLSACNTGVGQLAKGEGVMSLARSFRIAGCPNILMSLWQANDASTRIIMESFFRNLKEGIPKDEALRQAKLDYLDKSDLSHPFYWSTFILMGDDQPFEESLPWWTYGSLALAFLIIIAIFITLIRRKR